MRTKIQIPEIPDEEKTPIVSELLTVVAQQSAIIQQLRDEIARLKGEKPRPEIRPSQLEQRLPSW